MKRVVIVDADAEFLQDLERDLTAYDFDVTAVTDPGNIFDLIYHYEPDLVLVNYILNDGNGGTISHQIKTDPDTHELPVIIMSDYTDLRTMWRKFGCNDYILKPISIQDLVDKMNFWLKNARNPALTR